jgi:hypothetical protein
MLVKRAFETDGEVIDCTEVVAASGKYRQSQDCITGFINESIVKMESKSIGKQTLNDAFKNWFQVNYGNRKPPKLSELEEIMNKKFGHRNLKNRWNNVMIKEEEGGDAMDDIE